MHERTIPWFISISYLYNLRILWIARNENFALLHLENKTISQSPLIQRTPTGMLYLL